MKNEPAHREKAEFDSYAARYSAGMENPVKRIFGNTIESFIGIRIRWLFEYLKKDPFPRELPPENIRLLDFGCGTGESLQVLHKMGFAGRVEGCDISECMITEAVKRWQCGPVPSLHLIKEDGKINSPDDSYDVIMVSCVFHHIDRSKYGEIFAELKRVLKPGGRLVLFEHNPINPLTKWIVSRTYVDRNAVLVKAGVIEKMLSMAGFENVRTQYLLFFPPRLRWKLIEKLESSLWWLPLGGQYVVSAKK